MKKAKIIVLAGQSNAVGVGHVKYLANHFSEEKVEKYINGYEDVLINYYSHDMKSEGFVKTSAGCTEKTKETIGPEVGIAETLKEKFPDEEFFIVKCAFGGTNLFHDWLPRSCEGDYDSFAYDDGDMDGEHYHTAGWCFNEFVKILNESIEILKDQGYIPEIIGFCWMQGESDAFTTETVSQYGFHYETLLKDFTDLFGEYMKNTVFVDGGISEIWQYYKEINQYKKEHAEKTVKSYFIDTIGEGLTTQNEPQPEVDIAHYDSDCTIKLGNLFAEKIIPLI